jgi:hypothetical protein
MIAPQLLYWTASTVRALVGALLYEVIFMRRGGSRWITGS